MIRSPRKAPEMDLKPDAEEIRGESRDRLTPKPHLFQWIWRPWHAKLWWLLIPIYWAGAAVAIRFPLLDAFFSSAFAGIMNVFMLPPITLMMLGQGYVRARFEPVDWSKRDSIDWNNSPFGRHHEIGMPPPEMNSLDPRSGAFWIGSPLNPKNHPRQS